MPALCHSEDKVVCINICPVPALCHRKYWNDSNHVLKYQYNCFLYKYIFLIQNTIVSIKINSLCTIITVCLQKTIVILKNNYISI